MHEQHVVHSPRLMLRHESTASIAQAACSHHLKATTSDMFNTLLCSNACCLAATAVALQRVNHCPCCYDGVAALPKSASLGGKLAATCISDTNKNYCGKSGRCTTVYRSMLDSVTYSPAGQKRPDVSQPCMQSQAQIYLSTHVFKLVRQFCSLACKLPG